MVTLTVLLLIVAAVRGDMDAGNLFSKGAVAAEGFWSFGDWTSAGPWMLGFLLGAFTIVGFESAANLAEETNDPERVVPRAMCQAVLASGVLGFIFLIAVTLAAGDPVALAESGTPIADVIKNTLGSVVSTLLLLMVVIAIFACGLVIMMTGVRLTWAMSRDERFPGWQQWSRISPRFHTPLKATVLFVVLAELILAIFSQSEDALFTLFGAATLLPAVIYAATVTMYLVKRKELPVNGKFDLGAWEKPILVVAVVWLVFELALFRDASFKDAWLYVIVMVVIGAGYLGFLLARRGRDGLAMPDQHSIDAVLDEEAGTHRP
jgi:amino acid transporter